MISNLFFFDMIDIYVLLENIQRLKKSMAARNKDTNSRFVTGIPLNVGDDFPLTPAANINNLITPGR